MGCTSEKSISSNSPNKSHRKFQDLDNSINNKNDLEKERNPKENHNESDEDQNEIKLQQIQEEYINNIGKDNNSNEEDNVVEEEEEEKEEEKEEEIEEGKEEEEEEEEEENEEDDGYSNREMIRQLTPYLQSKVNPNFNFPEVKNNTYVGKGLRRMKGYVSIVSKEELEKRRNAFWGTRVEGDPGVWNFLKELCDLPIGEEDNMKAMLEANEITPLKKCINVTYDRSGEVYEIPNYCINEPVSFDLPEMHIKKPEKKKVSFHVRKGTEKIKIKALNTTTVDKVKNNISQKIEVKSDKIRLFYRGKEMKNGNELWVYNIEDDCVVMLMCSG